jgi:hypothetical protein
MARTIFNHGAMGDWHPLDGVPPPEFVPDRWDGPHVGKRLVEALRVLMLMPAPRGPQQFGSGWPAFEPEYWERAQYADDPVWEAEQAAERNRIKPRPSSIEIAHMEAAIGWPAGYLCEFPQSSPPSRSPRYSAHVTAIWSTLRSGCRCLVALHVGGTETGLT